MDGQVLLRDATAPRSHDASKPAATAAGPGWLGTFLRRHLSFLLVVVAPMVLVAIYFFCIAANQYESEADFTVKSASQSNGGVNSGLAQMFGLGGAMVPSQSDSYSVGDYLSSHSAVAALQARLGLVRLFQRPEADLMARLHPAHPTAEQILSYYRRQVKVAYSSETGITTLKVHAFRPADARAIAETLLELGEQRVNELNQRVLENSLSVAQAQLREAEAGVVASQSGMTQFRQDQRDIDPDRASTAQINLLASLQNQLAESRAQLQALSQGVSRDSPQYVAAEQKETALATQVAAQSARLAGGHGAMAPDLGAYEGLKLRQDFASKRYESAAAALESAREQALKQQLYVIRVVEPNLPEKSMFPKRWQILITVFFVALLIYGIGWLILAGVREHAG